MFDKKRIFQIVILILLLAWYGFFLAGKIDLTTADLGRHLKNGQMILQGNFGLLNSNFYSYTQPDFPMVNHHWGGGLIFFLVEQAAGFIGLSLLYITISLLIFWLFFSLAQKESGFEISVLTALLLIPLMASRAEIRPEIFSYLFIALFFWILWHWRKGQLSNKWLFALPLIEILWVNTHIYFVFGPALIGLFWLNSLRSDLKRTTLLKARLLRLRSDLVLVVLILTSLAALVNPFGLRGVLEPFNIFREYGYRIIENQSVWFLENLGIISNPNLGLFKAAFTVLVLSFVLILFRNRCSFSLIYFCLAVVLGAISWLAIRNFTLFGFFALPIIAYNLKEGFRLVKKDKASKKLSFETILLVVFLGLVIFLITFLTHYQRLPLAKNNLGFGLAEGINQSAEFFKKEGLQGPIFNNYDIGGYLIYHLYPSEMVFVDNRPEAYSVSFFKDIYIPFQQDESVWQEQAVSYNFNVIFFNYHDATPWAQKFLISRVNDPFWAPVFVDNYAIIFLKRNSLNQSIIEKYELPKSHFRVVK